MSGIILTIDLSATEARERLAGLVARMERPGGFLRGVGEYLAEIAVPRNFAAEEGPDGTPWVRLRPATVRRREKLGHVPIRILRSNAGTSQALAATIAYRVEPGRVLVGSAMPYAAIHQLGGTIRKPASARWMAGRRFARKSTHPEGREVAIAAHAITIPARPFLGLSAEDGREIVAIAEDWLEG